MLELTKVSTLVDVKLLNSKLVDTLFRVTSIGSTAYDILALNSVLAVASTLVDVNVMFLYTNVKVSYLVVTVMAWFNMVVGVVTSLRIVSGTLASDVITSVRIVSVEEVTVANNVEAITFC